MINKEEFEFLGITKWHELGYRGQNIKIASKEDIINGTFDDVYCINIEKLVDKYSKHGTSVMDYIRQVAPDAAKISASTDGKTINGEFFSTGMDYLQANTPDILTTSFFRANDSKELKMSLYKQLYDKGCYLCCAAGNDGDKEINKITEGNIWKAIGACRYNKGKPKRATYSSQGEELDYMSFDYLITAWDNKKHSGTSFASPLFAGMLALVQCFFLAKTGKKLTHEQLDKFVMDNCIDLDSIGHDIKTGYGLFILPDPTTINIADYQPIIEIPAVEPIKETAPIENILKEEESMIEELVAIYGEEIVKAALTKVCENELNKDTPSEWAIEEIELAKAAGITDGSRPRDYATRQEVMLMTYRNKK